jgi:hypothetical protein
VVVEMLGCRSLWAFVIGTHQNAAASLLMPLFQCFHARSGCPFDDRHGTAGFLALRPVPELCDSHCVL